MKSWLHDNDIKMYSTHNKGKSIVAERFIKTLKSKIYKHMIAISKNVYINWLDETVEKYNKTFHRTILMKPANVKLLLSIMTMILKSKLVIKLENKNGKIFSRRVTYEIDLKKFL